MNSTPGWLETPRYWVGSYQQEATEMTVRVLTDAFAKTIAKERDGLGNDDFTDGLYAGTRTYYVVGFLRHGMDR